MGTNFDIEYPSPLTPASKLVTVPALRVARAGYGAPLPRALPTWRSEHRARLQVAVTAAAPVIVREALFGWVRYFHGHVMCEAVARDNFDADSASYDFHHGALRAYEHTADMLEDHALLCDGRQVPPKPPK